MDEIAVLVAEELHFDVAGAGDELFEKHVGDAEGGAGLAAGLVEGVVELVRRQGDAHAAAAAAHRRLDDHGIAELLGQLAAPLRSIVHGSSLPDRIGHLGLLGDAGGPRPCRRVVRGSRRAGRRR